MTFARCPSLATVLVTSLFAVVALANCGCLLVAAGTAAGALAGAAYLNATVSATYFAYPNDVWMATRQGLTELGMPLRKESFDGFNGSLESTTPDGDRVCINLACMTPPGFVDGAMTKLSVRISSFGDRHASERIFRTIGSHIPAPTLPPISGPQAAPLTGAALGTPAGAISRPLGTESMVIAPQMGKPLTIQASEIPSFGNANAAQTGEPPIQPVAPPQIQPVAAQGSESKTPALPPAPVPTNQTGGTGG
jgi:hypothetical protein